MAWVRRNIHDVLFITALQIVCLWMGCSVAMGVRTLQAGSMFVDKKKIQKYQFSAFSLSPSLPLSFLVCTRVYAWDVCDKNADGLQLHYSSGQNVLRYLSSRRRRSPKSLEKQPTSASTTKLIFFDE